MKEINFIGKKKMASSMTINEKEAASATKHRKFDIPTLKEEKLCSSTKCTARVC